MKVQAEQEYEFDDWFADNFDMEEVLYRHAAGFDKEKEKRKEVPIVDAKKSCIG